jgi:hypothetical protein
MPMSGIYLTLKEKPEYYELSRTGDIEYGSDYDFSDTTLIFQNARLEARGVFLVISVVGNESYSFEHYFPSHEVISVQVLRPKN